MKKMLMMSLPLAVASFFVGNAVHAGTLSIDVPAGQTNSYTSAIGSDVTSITKTGGGRLHLAQGTTQNAFAGTININDGTLGADSPPNFGKPTTVTVANGATFDLSAIAGNSSAGSIANANLVIAGYGAGDAGAFRRATGGGQDYLLKNITLTADSMFYNAVRCGASGGTIDLAGHTLEKRGGGEFLFNGAAVRNMGRLIVNGGTLTIQGTGCRFDGDESNVVWGKSGTLTLWATPGIEYAPKWTLVVSNAFTLATGSVSAQGNVWNGPVDVVSNVTLSVNFWDANANITLAGPVRNRGTLQKNTNGTLVFSGSTTTNHYINGNARIRYTGDGTGRHEIGSCTIANSFGRIDFENAGHVHLYNNTFWMAGNGNNLNTISVSNTVLEGLVGSSYKAIRLGWDTGYNGRLIVENGGVVSNKLTIGYNGRGAVYQRGGEVYWRADDSSASETFGSYNYGFYGLDAGVCTRIGWMGTGIWSTNSCSFFVQRGGMFKSINGTMTMGGRGFAELYVGGGTNTQSAIMLGSSADYPQADAGTITVANNAVLSLGRNRLTAQHTNGFCAVVNLNSGGSLTCSRISAVGLGSHYGSDFFLNFDGGVLRPAQAWGFTDQWNASANDPTRATVYDGGIVMDASECAADAAVSRIPFPFQRPYGKGIKAIALPPADSPFWTKNFLGPTRIRISGAGKAATALVDFDLATAKPKGVIVTGAGFGYDDSTTATVASWDGKTNYPCAVTLFEHEAKGGFTLRGTLGATLIAANTWGGPTTVESGTLTFETAASYPVGSPLVMRPAGAVNFNNVARTLPSITGAGTIGNANVTVTNGLSFYVADASTNAYLHLTGKLTLGSGTTVSVLDHENLVTGGASMVIAKADGGIEGEPVLSDLDNRWMLYVSGKELRFGYASGTQILIR
jgi:autotransporter-associated beta strand protein